MYLLHQKSTSQTRDTILKKSCTSFPAIHPIHDEKSRSQIASKELLFWLALVKD